MAGQCCRFLNDIEGAISYLTQAAAIEKNDASLYLALGISLQLAHRYPEAVASLLRSLEIDPDCELAFNSLALTQKRMGEFDKAVKNFDGGTKALARRIVKGMRNDPASIIHAHFMTTHLLWAECAYFGGAYLCVLDGIERMAWPTGAQAEEEERNQRHRGLYWMDHNDTDGKRCRAFLPNFFNAFAFALKESGSYVHLIGNKATVLEILGNAEEAHKLLTEAQEFS
jgi:tetratricopeptide (TPR) repeat protein